MLQPIVIRAEPPQFRTGSALSSALSRPTGFEISGDPRRNALEVISHQFGVALFLDRRIDPDAPLHYRTQDTPLGTALKEIASQFDATITWLGPVGYIGPSEKVRKLQTVRAIAMNQVKNSPLQFERRLSQPRILSWDRLATPEEIMRAVTDNYHLRWNHAERLPHDLWPAGQFPPIDCATQCTILLAGFDAMPRFDPTAQSVEIEPIKQKLVLRRSYAAAPDNQTQLIKQWGQRFPHAEVQREGSKLIFSGLAEDHWQIDPATRPDDLPEQKQDDSISSGPQVYTLRVEAPIEAILAAIARQTGLTIQWQRQAIDAAGINPQKVVKLDVHEVSLETLIAELLKTNGLDYALEGKQLTVKPSGK